MTLHAIDCETWPVDLSVYPTPPLVCVSIAEPEPGSERLYTKKEGLREVRKWLESGDQIGGHNFVFDLGVFCNEDPKLIPLVFEALEWGHIVSSDILEMLHDIGRGCYGVDPETGQKFGDAETGARYPLALLERRYLGIDRSAEKKDPLAWRMRYHELDGVPLKDWPREAVDYPMRDARGTCDVLRCQLGHVPEYRGKRYNTQCMTTEMRAAWWLKLSSLYGIRTDPKMVAEYAAEIREKVAKNREKFFAEGLLTTEQIARKDFLAGETGDLPPEREGERPRRYKADTKAIKARVTKAYNGAPPMTSPSDRHPEGQVSTARETLTDSGDVVLEEYGASTEFEKLLSTYIPVLEQGTRTPIHPGITSIVSSDRTSYFNPNLQNLPRGGKVRKCYIARDGTVLCSVDYNMLELCTLGQLCIWLFGKSAIADAINLGQDLHVRFACRIAGGIPYEEGMKRKKEKDKTFLALRQCAKPCNFGLGGLMGPPKLVHTARKDGVKFCELAGVSKRCEDNPRVTSWGKAGYAYAIAPTCVECLQLAAKFKAMWLEEWPEMPGYFETAARLADMCAQGVPMESMSRIQLDRLDTSAGALSNHGFQHLAAVGAKHAGWMLTKECMTDENSVLFQRCRPVVFVHDEIITEVTLDFAHECALRQTEVMIAAMKEHVPDVKISAAPALMTRWYKEADAVYSNGRLVPWEPKS